MARNKKAQILAAVMCASSIFGSYTVVSAATPSAGAAISSSATGTAENDKASVTTGVSNGSGVITATAKNDSSQTSTISLNGNSLAINVGKIGGNSYDGTFTLNSKNLKIDSSNGLRIYDGINTSPTATITKAGAITGTKLTVNGAGPSTISSINSGNSAQYAKSEVSYSNVKDTVTNGIYTTTSTVAANGVTDSLEKWNGPALENKVSSTLNASGLTTTVQSKGAEAGIENINSTKNKTISAVAYNSVTDTVYDANGKKTSYSNVGTTSITDTVYDDNGSTIIATSNLYKNTDKNSGNKYGYTSLSASDYGDVIDKEGNLVNKQLGNTSLRMNESNANKIALSASSYEYDENLKQTATTASMTLDGSTGVVSLSGKNVNLNNNTFSLKNTTTGKDIAKIDSNGLNIYDGTNTSAKATISKAGAITGTGLTIKAPTDSIKPNNDYIQSQVTTSGVTNTIKKGGYNRAISKVETNSIKDTIYTDNGTELSYINVTKDSATNGIENGKVSLTAKKIVTNDGTTTTTTSSLTVDGDSAKLYADTSRATVQVYNTTGNVAITAGTVNGVQGNVTLSGKNVNLDGDDLTLYKDVNGTKTSYAALTASGGLTIYGDNGTNSTLSKSGLNVNGTSASTINSTGTSGSAKSTVSYNGGVQDIVVSTTEKNDPYGIKKNVTNKTTSTVSATGVANTVSDTYDGVTTNVASSNISKTSVKDSNDRYGSVNLNTAKYGDWKYNENSSRNNVKLGETSLSMSSSNNTVSISAKSYKYEQGGDGKSQINNEARMALDGSTGIVSLSGKNVNLDGNGLTLYKDVNGTKTSYAALTASGGLTIYGDNGTSSNSTLSKSGLNVNGTGTSTINSTGTSGSAKSTVSYSSGIQDIVINAATNNKTTSTVNATAVTDNVYDNILTDKPLATSNITKGNVKDSSDRYGSITLTANKYGDIYDDEGIATSNKQLGSTSLSLSNNVATISSTGYTYDEAGKQQSTTASMTLNGNTGNVTLSSKNANLTSTGLTLSKIATTEDGTPIKDINGNTKYTNYASLTTGGLTINGTSTSSIKSTGTKERYTKNEITSTGMTTTAQGDGVTYPGDSNDNSNKTTSAVAYNGVTDTVYDANGKKTSYSNVGTTSISDTVYDTDGNTILASSSISKSGKTGKIALTTNKYDEDGTKTTSSLTLDGENVLFSGKNATLSGSTLTLKDGSNNTARLTATGLSFTDASGQQIGAVSSTGAISGTSLNITAKDTAGNKLASSSVTTSGITNTTYGKNITDTVYGTDGTTQVASSSVGISGISNNTNISGIAIKDDVNNTKRMTTSIAQNANGVNISSTKYNVYNDGTSKVQTIDGISTISVNGAKTTISGSGNYEYKKDENGKLILDDKGNPIRSSNTSASLSVDGDTGTISLSGKNASLSNSTFTLKDITSGNSVASLGTSGLSLNKVNSDGTTANYGTWNSSGLTVTTTNIAGNKTTSTANATSVTDRVYDTDGKTQVAYSSVGTGGISNTTSLKTDTGKIDTAINQNKFGVSISSTAYSGQNLKSGNSSVSVNGAKTTISSYGGYEYDAAGKVLKYNTASLSLDGNAGTIGLSGKNVSLTNTGLTLKNVETGKSYVTIGSNGLNIYNDEGTSVFGVTRTGAINIDKNVTIDDSYTKDGYTYTASNSISGSNGISNVATKKDESGKTIATNRSTVTTSGITNSTNISGIAIKDDKYNTKTMNTSIAQNANGVNISSTKYNVYNDGTNTVQTTDGTSSISVNGAKTTISGYGNYEYEKDENGKLVVSNRNSASLSVDGESGIISLSGKNVGLNANGLTLYKDVEGVKTQYASLTAGGLNVNGTGTTTIKSTNATTGAMGQSQLSYNGVTDTVTNAAGNKTTSTVNATGTIDQVYDTDGKTRIAYSNITTTGITDSFTKDGITNSVTTNANGTTFASTGNGSTTIKGGAITTNSITVAGNIIDDEFFEDIGHTSGKTEGIDRYGDDNVGYTTSIETTFKVHSLGTGSVDIFGSKIESTLNGQTTVINGGSITTNSLTVGNVSFGDLVNRVDVLEDKTQNITPSNPGTGEGGSVVPPTIDGQTGMEGDLTVAGEITANSGTIGGVAIQDGKVTANNGGTIGGVTMKDNTVTVGGTEGTSINKDGVTVGDKKSDNYTSITNNDVVVNNNGSKTSLADVGNRVTGLESSVNSMNNRLSDVEDRIDKVGAMSAAIANLRTMGFDPEAPTEIAVGIGQYKNETGLALGIFHYPNQDFMLSASISTAGDEVMGGIGATWKLGRKSAAEKAKDEEARRLEKAEEMKKLAQDAKVKAQAERHAKLLAEREAQKIA